MVLYLRMRGHEVDTCIAVYPRKLSKVAICLTDLTVDPNANDSAN